MPNSNSEVSNEILEGLPAPVQNVHDLQFGDIGRDEISPDSQGGIMGHVSDPINTSLERQAAAMESLAAGIRDIAQALREIAVAIASQNREMPVRNIEPPID